MNAHWLLSLTQNIDLPPCSRLVAVSAWGKADEAAVVVAPAAAQARLAASCSMPLEQWQQSLTDLAEAGWLAPLEWGPSGELRTRLTVPEGV
jgi:hypothetical protein